MKVISLRREQWLDINFKAPGGSSWQVDGRANAGVVAERPIFNMKINTVADEGDPTFSRVSWQPVFTFEQLPGLADVSGLFRLYKINSISMTLFPMRATNSTVQNTATPPIAEQHAAPNVLITTLYAKSGLDNRLGLGTDALAQIQNKRTQLYNLGIGTKKIGWYFKPVVQDMTYKNPQSTVITVADNQVDIGSAFSYTVRKPGYQDIETGKSTEHFGPVISIRSVDGSNLAAGNVLDSNMNFRCCVKYYFSLKGTH